MSKLKGSGLLNEVQRKILVMFPFKNVFKVVFKLKEMDVASYRLTSM